jgi:hypothetical protein
MRRRELRHHLDAAGPALETWRATERAAALRLLERSKAARADFVAALDAETAPPLAPDAATLARMQAGLARRLEARLHRVAPRRAPVALSFRLHAPVRWGAVAACFVAGAWLGLAGQGPAAHPAQELAPLHIQPILADSE